MRCTSFAHLLSLVTGRAVLSPPRVRGAEVSGSPAGPVLFTLLAIRLLRRAFQRPLSSCSSPAAPRGPRSGSGVLLCRNTCSSQEEVVLRSQTGLEAAGVLRALPTVFPSVRASAEQTRLPSEAAPRRCFQRPSHMVALVLTLGRAGD